MFSCKYWDISKKPILKSNCIHLFLKRLQEVIDLDFLSGELLSKTPRLSDITKIQFTFKPEPSLNLTLTLYVELRSPIFIINGYDRKANPCSPWTSCYFCLTRNFPVQIEFSQKFLYHDCQYIFFYCGVIFSCLQSFMAIE